MVMSQFVKFSSWLNPLEQCSDHFFLAVFASQWGINEDPTVWLDGARSRPKYVFKNNMNLTTLKIGPIHTLHLSSPSRVLGGGGQ